MAADSPHELFHPRTRGEWRRWLAKHHATARGVQLVFARQGSGIPTIGYDEAVEEALCFGWVDSIARKLDEHRRAQLFTPRKPKSTWSRSNKERVGRLIDAGLMTDAGLKKIESAQADGSWGFLDSIEALEIPADLAAALKKNAKAKKHFDAFPPSSKKIILLWVASAKREETRAKRVAETVSLAAKNIRANHYDNTRK